MDGGGSIESAVILDPKDPTITVGGRTFSIPQLAIRQSRVIIPAVGELAKDSDLIKGSKLLLQRHIDLMLVIIHAGIKRASPNVSMDELLDLPISQAQLSEAVTIVAKQAGMTMNAAPAEGAAAEPGKS